MDGANQGKGGPRQHQAERTTVFAPVPVIYRGEQIVPDRFHHAEVEQSVVPDIRQHDIRQQE